MPVRLPAEWEPQSAVQLTWPHAHSDWASLLDQVEPLYQELTRQLLDHVAVIIAAPESACSTIKNQLADHPRADRLSVYPIASNDTWARDHGPITLELDDGLQLLDFTFNGWGNKFDARLDNEISRRLSEQGAFGTTPLQRIDLVLEGGAIESDGQGTLLTTEACLLNPNRNPELSKQQVEDRLKSLFGVRKINWLAHGYLAGDDTDSHIDTLARLCPGNIITYVDCDDPADEHYAELTAMAAELQQLTNASGESYQLVGLPWPSAIFSEDGDRLPATYANFLITNGAVLVPTYEDPKDEIALSTLARVFPDRKIIGLNALPLIEQHGSLHCITMQLPAGVH